MTNLNTHYGQNEEILSVRSSWYI